MSEMVERVAKAMYAVNPVEDSGEAIDGFQVTPASPLKWETVVECYEDVANGFREEARAAMAAMREPTRAMVEGASTGLDSEGFGITEGDARLVWQSMIDLACPPVLAR